MLAYYAFLLIVVALAAPSPWCWAVFALSFACFVANFVQERKANAEAKRLGKEIEAFLQSGKDA